MSPMLLMNLSIRFIIWQQALEAKVSKALVMQYFYPDITVEQMREAWGN